VSRERPLRVWYLFNRPRAPLVAQAQAGEIPADYYAFYGLHRVGEWGIEARFSDRGFPRRRALRGVNAALTRVCERFTGVGFNLVQALALLGDLRRSDVVFATADSSALPVALLKRLGLLRTPLVYQSIGLTTLMARRRAVVGPLRWLAGAADRVTVCSPAEAREWQELLGVAAERITFIPNCVESDYFAPGPEPREGPFVLSAGRDRLRDFPTLIRALAGSGVALKIVTRPEMGRMLPPAPHVELLYNLPLSALRALYAGAACVAVPCRPNAYAAGNTVLLEAMAMGKAVVASATAGLAEGYRLTDGVNCRLVPPGDAAALRAAVLEILADPGRAAQWGAEARRTVVRHFSPREQARRLAALFRSVIDANHGDTRA
jgi:glycosyltransferase involved in cell wall biosynthesis